MANYCQAYFPVPVFKYARSFFKGDMQMQLLARDYSSEALSKLFYFVSYFRRINAEKKFNLGSYGIKTLLHSITLFPTLYLQAKGILVYKKFSFDIARKDFSKNDWKAVDYVSGLRQGWKDSGAMPLSRLTRINPLAYYQLSSRAKDLLGGIRRKTRLM